MGDEPKVDAIRDAINWLDVASALAADHARVQLAALLAERALLLAVVEALPRCWKCHHRLATRYAVEAQAPLCDQCILSGHFTDLPYAPALRAWKTATAPGACPKPDR